MLEGPTPRQGLRDIRRQLLYRRPSYVLQNVPMVDVRQIGAVLLSLLVCGLAFWLRVAIDGILPPGFPFLTFFPAIIFCTFTLGMWPGIACAIMGGLLSVYYFIPPDNFFDMSPSSWVAIGFYAFISTAFIVMLTIMDSSVRKADLAQRQAEANSEFQAVMAREMNHRIKNLFAVITSIVRLTAKSSDDMASFSTQLAGRISSLSHSHELVWESDGQTEVSVRQVIERIIVPLQAQASTALSVSGDHKLDNPHLLQVLSLLVHELATNASKYGAFSDSGGSLDINIEVRSAPNDTERNLVLSWRERFAADNTNSRHASTRSGFGTEMIRRLVDGVDGVYAHEVKPGQGVDARIELPLDQQNQA